MRSKRKSGTIWRRARVRPFAAVALPVDALAFAALVFAGAFGCTAYPTFKNVAINCSIENAYDFDPRILDGSTTYSSGDPTVTVAADGAVVVGVQQIPEGALCGSPTAFVVQSSHHNDWGSLAGFYGFGAPYRDESPYEGMSFWSRAPGVSGKSFTIALDDANTFATTPDAGANCTNYYPDGGNQGPPMNATDPMTGLPISGSTTSAPPSDACGNSYSTPVVVSSDWRFYTIPFTRFRQGAMPSRVPNAKLMETGSVPGTGLLTDKLMGLVFRLPKEVTTDLWLAKLTFYRNRTGGTASDGGADAPRM